MIGKRLMQLRKEMTLTQSELAEKVGISRSSLSLYEIDKREPDIETLMKLASFFDVSVDCLIGQSDDEHNPADYEWRFSKASNRFGRIMAHYREKEGVSEGEMASRLDVPPETYAGLETGRYTPSMAFLQKFQSVSGYDMDYLTGAKDGIHVPAGNIVLNDLGEAPVYEYIGDRFFPARLENLRLKQGISSEDAPECLGLTQQEYIDVSFNRMPTLSELLRIAYGLDVSLDYLVGRTDRPALRLSEDEMDLVLNYRDCLPQYQKHLSKRASDLCKESIDLESVAADSEPLKRAK